MAEVRSNSRAGFGKSELDSTNQDINKHGILNGIEGLEIGLKNLGYDGNIMLVASSFGGFCATMVFKKTLRSKLPPFL